MFLQSTLAMLTLSGLGVTVNRPPCEAPEAGTWVTEQRDRLLAHDGLVRFAIDRYGPPVLCEGETTSQFDGNVFGTLRLEFEGGVTFRLETMPPEASAVTLEATSGFQDETALRGALERYAADVGVEIDWAQPTPVDSGQQRQETYWDPDDGLNASAKLLFADDVLVSVRFSLAL